MKGSFAEPVEVEEAKKEGTTPYGRKMANWRHWWRRWHIRCEGLREWWGGVRGCCREAALGLGWRQRVMQQLVLGSLNL